MAVSRRPHAPGVSRVLRLAAAGMLALSLVGCATTQTQRTPPEPLPQPTLYQPETRDNGAIYQAGRDVRLFEDRTARRVGDVVTVVLEEETDASKNANMDVAKNSSYSLPTPTIAGRQPTLGGEPFSFDIDSEQDFQGGGSASQSNALSGTLTATVIRVERNGNLVIQGQKQITLNRGEEYVTITGLVRPDDVNANNMVSSTRIANARISYTGSGELADSNRMGWLSRLFMSVIWPL
ncbi:flagellar basal body L-ring protein FlgH [Arhodomonas sp. AD133]|uniref:flagellar basal body L-ring protein FlgH n=1 Tax=Arhodomonas sp. AD133 TaxID=3415009 RepID=UPI003EBDF139